MKNLIKFLNLLIASSDNIPERTKKSIKTDFEQSGMFTTELSVNDKGMLLQNSKEVKGCYFSKKKAIKAMEANTYDEIYNDYDKLIDIL